jgi:hypothetical protein
VGTIANVLEDVFNGKIDVVGGKKKARMLDTLVEEDGSGSLSSVESGSSENLVLLRKGKRLDIGDLLIRDFFRESGMGG